MFTELLTYVFIIIISEEKIIIRGNESHLVELI